jgi:hypothetical protein
MTTQIPSPLRGEGARRADEGFSLSSPALLAALSPAVALNPSSGAARHLLPSGEKETGASGNV